MNRNISAFVIAAMFAGYIMLTYELVDYGFKMRHATKQCEAELPRHLSCEPVYGARVVEEKDDEAN